MTAKRSATEIACLHRDRDHGTQRRRRRRKIHDFPRSRGNSSHSEPVLAGVGTLSFLLSTALQSLQEHQCQGTLCLPPAQPWAQKPAL